MRSANGDWTEPLHGRYQVQHQLGQRAGRQTFIAQDLKTQERVVIKLLTFNREFEWQDLKLFEREAEILQSLTHPAIPHYLDHFELDLPTRQGFALVQTYLEAPSLEEHRHAGRTFSEPEIVELAKEMLEILIYLHQRQPAVIHRDIKPSNILLTNRSGNSVGQVYLVDFGSVQTLAAKEGGTITIVGTYGYMPPEQFGGRAVPASDLYSLGATLIYLVTGQHPADLPQVDLRIEFEQATTLSPRLTRWLRRMTEPSLNRRFASSQEALEALDRSPTLSDLLPLPGQPAHSAVQLTKTGDTLEILIPPPGLTTELVSLFTFAIAWNFFVFFWSSMALRANLLFALFSLPFWLIGIRLLLKVFSTLLVHTRLKIGPHYTTLTYELLGFEYSDSSALDTQNISRLTYSTHSLATHWGRGGSRNLELNPPHLTLWSGVRKYELGHSLSKLELDWLAQELSDWLNLPIESD